MGKITVSANGKSVVTSKSGGKAIATIPDVCKVPFPPPVGTIPIPFPNIAESKNLDMGSIITKFDGGSVALFGSKISKSTGDEMGSAGGIISGCNKGEAFFLGSSPDVMVEMRPVCRKGDLLVMNKINTIALAGMDQDDVGEVEDIEEVELEPFKIQLKDGNDPWSNVSYKLVARNIKKESTTDSNGFVEAEIPKGCKQVKIVVNDEELITIKIQDTQKGRAGTQMKLSTLGLYSGRIDGSIGPVSKKATCQFQEQQSLKIDGDPGSKTKGKLDEIK